MEKINLKSVAATTVYEDVEVSIPYFSRSKDEKVWLAVLDEKTCIRIVLINDYINIIREKATDNYMAGKILEAQKEFHSCTEQEFLEKYDQVVESISLHPKLAV